MHCLTDTLLLAATEFDWSAPVSKPKEEELVLDWSAPVTTFKEEPLDLGFGSDSDKVLSDDEEVPAKPAAVNAESLDHGM